MANNDNPYPLPFDGSTLLDNSEFVQLLNGPPINENNIFSNLFEHPVVIQTNSRDASLRTGGPHPHVGDSASQLAAEYQSGMDEGTAPSRGCYSMEKGWEVSIGTEAEPDVSDFDRQSGEGMSTPADAAWPDWLLLFPEQDDRHTISKESTLANILEEDNTHNTSNGSSSTLVESPAFPCENVIPTAHSSTLSRMQDCNLCGRRLYSSNEYHLKTHQRGKACRKARNKENLPPPMTLNVTVGHAQPKSPSNHVLNIPDPVEASGWFPGNAMDCLPVDSDFAAQVTENLSLPMDVTTKGSKECVGIALEWTAGPIFDTFPWQLMRDQKQALNFHITHIKGMGDDAVLWLKSSACSEGVTSEGGSCYSCATIPSSKVLRNAAARAREAAPAHTNYEYLNHRQTNDKLTKRSSEKQVALKEVRSSC